MHDDVDLMIAEDGGHEGLVPQIADKEGNALGYGFAVAKYEAIEHHGRVAREGELANTVATDIASTSDNENIHGPFIEETPPGVGEVIF